MFAASEMQTNASALFSAYASLAASMMLIRSMANDIIPNPVQSYLQKALHYFFTPLSSEVTVVVDEDCGFTRNQVYDAAEIYLRTKIGPNAERFKVSKTPKRKNINVSIEKNEEVVDTYRNFHLKWRLVSVETKNSHSNEKRFFELRFNKRFKDVVIDEYLPFVLTRANEIKQSDRFVKLYTADCQQDYEEEGGGGYSRKWGSIRLDHPATFETLAMEPETKKDIIDDLDRFVRRRDFYKKVGKAWKRGYLLYGPPGTGKSSLIAAMANYLKFDVYDLELTSLYSNSELRRILLSTTNRSIIVIEDIDCSVEMQDRRYGNRSSDSKLTLSGLLNFIDGLWSSCGDERIIVFSTNHKDKLDPALLRPGRMDMHIHMSYCTFNGFMLLAHNYLNISDDDHHRRFFDEIKALIKIVEATPAELAEELMKTDDVNVALEGVVRFLGLKKPVEVAHRKVEDETTAREAVADDKPDADEFD